MSIAITSFLVLFRITLVIGSLRDFRPVERPSFLIISSSFLAFGPIIVVRIIIYLLYKLMYLFRFQDPSFFVHHRHGASYILIDADTVEYERIRMVISSQDEARQSTEFPGPVRDRDVCCIKRCPSSAMIMTDGLLAWMF